MTFASDNRGSEFKLVATSRFSTDELVEIYNAGRTDYIVPMLTDAEHLQNYIRMYDIDLDASVVILDSHNQPAGIGMLGVRGDRCWITRLGITPERREGGMGTCMMQALIAAARERHARLIQLEVIEGNDPAHRLFLRCGFKELRRLMVVRRPTGALPVEKLPPWASVSHLIHDEIWECLVQRDTDESWVTENASLAKIEALQGLRVILASGDSGWIIFRCQDAEMTHVVWKTTATQQEQLLPALLYHLHSLHPEYSAKIENFPVNDHSWVTLQQFNYIEEFRRVEMFLHL